jgi:putative DNA primase/helicase
MNDPVGEVLRRLRNRGIEPRKSGAGWSARCPAHEDRNPSLSVRTGDDGRALVFCHAGCDIREITRVLGMAPSELFSRDSGSAWTRRACAERRPLLKTHRAKKVDTPTKLYSTCEAALGLTTGSRSSVWLYRAADGRLAGAVARIDRGNSGKTFRQASVNPAGDWIAKGMPSPRPLYRLPELLAGTDDVFVVEGEKCADAVARLGLVSTTSVGGATNAHHSDWSPLRVRRVVVIPDADEQGERYATDVAALAQGDGALNVRILRIASIWPEVPLKGDIADWVAAQSGADVDSLRAVLERHAVSASVASQIPTQPQSLLIRSQRIWRTENRK